MVLARWQATIVDDAGNIQTGASIEVRSEAAGAPLATIYSDRDGLTPLGNPFLSDSEGFAAFHVPGGAYRITATKGSFSREWRYVGIGTLAEQDSDNPIFDNLALSGYLDLAQIAAPSNPDSGVVRVYAFDDGGVAKIGIIDSGGALTTIGNGVGLPAETAIGWDSDDITLTHSAGLLTLGGANNAGLVIEGGETISFAPTGNSPTTFGSLSVQATTQKSANREFALNVGLISNLGQGLGTPTEDKVGIYSGIVGQSGSGSIWAGNFLMQQDASSGSYNGRGIEIDVNNNNAHRGDSDLGQPSIYGMSITGASSFRITGGLIVHSADKMFNRGIVLSGDCINLCSLEDDTNSPIVFDINGSHATGLDMTGATISGNAIALASGHKIDWASGDVTITHSSNQLAFDGADTAYLFRSSESAGSTSLRVHNTSTGNTTTKLAEFAFYGTDTVGTVKETARIEAVPGTVNWVSSVLKIYSRDADALIEVARHDKPSTAGQTGLMLWDVDNNTLERVTVGAANSGGTNFKLLRIPN